MTAQTCDGSAEQQWTISDDGYISLTSNPQAVLDVYDCATEDNSVVEVWTKQQHPSQAMCQGLNQMWNVKADGTITNKNSGKCLDVYNFKGPNVETWTCNGGANQVGAKMQ